MATCCHSVFHQLVNDDNYKESNAASDSLDSDCESEMLEYEPYEPDEFDLDLPNEPNEETGSEDITVSGRTWKSNPPSNRESPPKSLGWSLTAKSESVQTIGECFHLFINEEIIDNIILYTNKKAEQSMRENRTWKKLDRVEIDAFFGLLLLMGRFGEFRESEQDLWKQDTGLSRPHYIATMSRDRFINILKYIRFDDSTTREERRKHDKLAALREVTNIFTQNCKDCYNATSVGCVDSQVVKFHDRCSFKVCMQDKMGIKIWTLCDSNTFYCCNMDVYLGKMENETEKQQGRRVVKRLSEIWKDSNRCIATNNFLTDIELAEELVEDKIFMIGALRKSQQDLPKILGYTKNRSKHSSEFLYTENVALLSYIPETMKRVVLLSSLHGGQKKLAASEMLNCYKNAKGGVDKLATLLQDYSCRRATSRWTLALFMHFLDIAAYNAFVIWQTKNPNWKPKTSLKIKRKLFIEKLAESLTLKNINSRATEFEHCRVFLHKHIINAIEATGRTVIKKTNTTGQKRSRCYICIGNNNKYNTKCENCDRHICSLHSLQNRMIVCNNCCITTVLS
ncbi:uncharacterized protein LOC108626410 [Ceratina calcarata]|uniref:Uncharacterized protein LOC108626410 n=1 Tax=Ceratina calcarata TaxID=156304 RepID=A0AAJ7J1I5_9HYME|nr:uncharacterized protein LOC108626410 [Ceratina calcarata]